MAKSVFYSFHFDNDVMRVQLIRNIGAIEDNKPVSANDWETVKRGGSAAIEKWIDDNMKYRRCVVVLVGSETASRPWVKHEIKKAWEEKRGLIGVRIHNVKHPQKGVSVAGPNPFSSFTIGTRQMNLLVPCYDPGPDAYNTVKTNLEAWVDNAIAVAARR